MNRRLFLAGATSTALASHAFLPGVSAGADGVSHKDPGVATTPGASGTAAVSQTAEIAQKIPYGNNPQAGQYLHVGDCKIYYEVYGKGSPLLLLHGDTFGYIDEFENYLAILGQQYKVIAIGMRGHGKSGIGTKPYSYKLFAEDAIEVLHNESEDHAAIVGFSAGAITAYYLAAYYPGKITKAVIMGGMLNRDGYKPTALKELQTITGADCEKILPGRVRELKALMPEPNLYQDMIVKLRNSWLQPVYVDQLAAASIHCPVLIVGGDRDEYIKLEAFTAAYHLITHAQLAIVPGCGHVGLLEITPFFESVILPFLFKKDR